MMSVSLGTKKADDIDRLWLRRLETRGLGDAGLISFTYPGEYGFAPVTVIRREEVPAETGAIGKLLARGFSWSIAMLRGSRANDGSKNETPRILPVAKGKDLLRAASQREEQKAYSGFGSKVAKTRTRRGLYVPNGCMQPLGAPLPRALPRSRHITVYVDASTTGTPSSGVRALITAGMAAKFIVCGHEYSYMGGLVTAGLPALDANELETLTSVCAIRLCLERGWREVELVFDNAMVGIVWDHHFSTVSSDILHGCSTFVGLAGDMGLHVTTRHVSSHTGEPMNEQTDALAKSARQHAGLYVRHEMEGAHAAIKKRKVRRRRHSVGSVAEITSDTQARLTGADLRCVDTRCDAAALLGSVPVAISEAGVQTDTDATHKLSLQGAGSESAAADVPAVVCAATPAAPGEGLANPATLVLSAKTRDLCRRMEINPDEFLYSYGQNSPRKVKGIGDGSARIIRRILEGRPPNSKKVILTQIARALDPGRSESSATPEDVCALTIAWVMGLSPSWAYETLAKNT